MDPEKNTANISSKKLNIFIIDDDKFLLDTYALKFTKCGYAVSYAFSGDEALKKLHDGFAPDILLVDNIMPVFVSTHLAICSFTTTFTNIKYSSVWFGMNICIIFFHIKFL